MNLDFALAKANARRAVHNAFGVQAFYSDASISTPVEIRARWHNKISKPFGDLENGGYSEIIEGIDRIIFVNELVDDETTSVLTVDGFPIVPVRNATVSFPTLLPGVEFNLDHQEPSTGPVEEVWFVTRK